HELELPSWNIDLVIPVVHSKLSINNLISDSTTNIGQNESGIISLIFKEELININLDTLIKIDAIADEQTHTLDSASFADVIISDTATLGESINKIPLLSLVLPNGSSNIIPAIPSIASNDTISINASEYFETMNLYQGTLKLDIKNEYPTDISNISLTLINATNQNIIATFLFPLIPTGTTVSDSVSIAGQILDENLFAILDNMDVNASNGAVLIDYSDAIITTITISDIGITEATAIFPEQQLTETLKEHTFDLGGVQLNEVGIKSGTVTVNVLSTLPNGKMIYNIPSLKKNGVSFSSGDIIIPQATGTELTTFEFNFEGYKLDLTGEENRNGGDTINTIYTESFTFIDYTGTLETINATDSFYSYIEFDLTPEYATGFLGTDTISFGPEIIESDIFDFIQSGSIDFEQADMSININNFIGADMGLQITNLSSTNENTEVNVSIDNNFIYEINRAQNIDNQINSTLTQINFEGDKLLEIFPNKFNTSATFYLNPYGQNVIEDFLYPEFTLDANINIEVPLKVNANNLTLVDTSEIEINEISNYEIQKVFFNIENGFPLDIKLKILLLDVNDIIIDTLVQDINIDAAQVDVNNIVVNNQMTTVEVDYQDFTNVKKAILISSLNTIPNNEYISLYSNYEIDIAISAKINKLLSK
ncbi:hypothetical protein OAQ21_04745, partial [Flavobacteriales bacterium]|nr:hypothetical protein [Flavobacteriales bacterium]